MKNISKFIIFIIYTIVIFLIKDLKVLGALFLLNFILTKLFKIKFKKVFYHFKIFLPFILLTVIINIIFGSIQEGILIGIRMVICYHATYLFSCQFTVPEIADTIEKLFYPLKIVKINTNHIGIIVSIAICMIPVLKNEIYTMIQAMKSKGKLMKINSMVIVMKPTLISILRKTSQMEKTLMVKAYLEQ